MAPAVGNVGVGLPCLYLWVGGYPAFVSHLGCLLTPFTSSSTAASLVAGKSGPSGHIFPKPKEAVP